VNEVTRAGDFACRAVESDVHGVPVARETNCPRPLTRSKVIPHRRIHYKILTAGSPLTARAGEPFSEIPLSNDVAR